jgi:hypothetical protein
MRYFSFFMMGFLLIPSLLLGQAMVSDKDFGVYFSPSLGSTFAQYKNLNQSLGNVGHPTFNNLHVGVGLDLSLDYKNISGFFHVFSSLGQSKQNIFNLNNSTDILTTELGLEYRMNIEPINGIQLSFFGSRGSMLTTLTIENGTNTNNFTDVLTGSGNTTSLDNISTFWVGGAGLYWKRNEHLRYNFKIGYRRNEDAFWIPYTSNSALANSPKDNLSGLFANIGLDVNINVFKKN